ncbi:Piwi domain-containing protein [Kalaharituber pfeilii]|nr:Piwi domain-containing protein [Kalaharituber pfeilii]
MINSLQGSAVAGDVDREQALQCLNLVLGRYPSRYHLNPTLNKYFIATSRSEQTFGPGVEALRGYFSSVRPTVNGLTCNINLCTSAFMKPGSLLDVMNEIIIKAGDRHFEVLERTLTKIKVTYDYTGTPTMRTIYKVETKTAGEAKFTKNGEDITVQDYFLQAYNRKLTNPDRYVVNLGSRNREILVPPEFCTIVPGQRYRGSSRHFTAEMIKFAKMPAAASRNRILTEGMETLGHLRPRDTVLKDQFGIEVSKMMLVVKGRILCSPQLSYKNSTFRPEVGRWQLSEVKFLRSIPKIKVAVIIWDPIAIRRDLIQEFYGELKIACEKYGLVMETDPKILLGTDIDKHLQLAVQKQCDMALFVLGTKDRKIYANVKRMGDIVYGIPTLCLQFKTCIDRNHDPATLANIAMKLNSRFGGLNHALSHTPTFLRQKVMILGMDLTHASAGSLPGAPSIAGVVASVDGNYSLYLASMKLQTAKDAGQGELRKMTLERLRVWHEKNDGSLPDAILAYRDGVSEGEYEMVLNEELPQIEAACKDAVMELYNRPHTIKITLLVVGKRHHTRFYTKHTPSQNPAVGTTVDEGITDPLGIDWYAQTHACPAPATAKPAHYILLKDENQLSKQAIQEMTYSLCYLYSRCPLAVSICPPARYADLLCERGRCYIYDVLNPDYQVLKDTQQNAQQGATAEERQNNLHRAKQATWGRAMQLWGEGVHSAIRGTMFYI